jgi:hypothetical protein
MKTMTMMTTPTEKGVAAGELIAAALISTELISAELI